MMMMMSDYPCAAMSIMRGMHLSRLCWIVIFGNLSWQYLNPMNCRKKVLEGCKGGGGGGEDPLMHCVLGQGVRVDYKPYIIYKNIFLNTITYNFLLIL